MKHTLRMFYDDMGSFTQPGVENREDALWHVNNAREHDGLAPMSLDTFNSLFGRELRKTVHGWAKMEPQH